ncbi:MAG: NB-ARC domain-containing protein [Promethearchaeota archaeon]
MLSQVNILKNLKELLTTKTVFSISGASGTGKTTLAQYLVGNFLTSVKPYDYYAIWVQASESFSKKRLEKMFANSPEKLNYLKKNILITPKDKRCGSIFELSKTLNNIFNESSLMPPNLRFIVIDNVSHHLRYESSKIKSIKCKVHFLNEFFNDSLFPLIMFCERNGINLVLIHEISYDPNTNRNVSFFHKLYDRIKSINVFLSKEFYIEEKLLKITIDGHDSEWNLKYKLIDSGFCWFD